jgi:flagellar biosynthesis protein FlhG
MRTWNAAPTARSEDHPPAAPRRPCLWAVAGGKGGVGKSMLTSSLAVSLAGRGRRVVLVDADLGGANVHTLFGISAPPRSLSHFLSGEVPRLENVLCPTSVANLRIVSGSQALLNMANPKYSQKEKLLRHLRALDADDVLLDLGAGSSFNVLDFFLAAQRGILVVIPEPTSIDNAYHFLKAAFYRSLRAVVRRAAVNSALTRVLDERIKRRVRSPLDLIAGVTEIDREAGAVLEERARAFNPMLIVNQTHAPDHRALGNKMMQVCREHLGTSIRYLGAVERDQHVVDAVNHRKPVLQLFPTCPFAKDVSSIVERLLEERAEQTPAARSDVLLPPLDVSRPGAYLRACREKLGLDLTQLSERTQIRSLEAIENESYRELPPGPYVRSFVLQYARELGIKEAEILAASYVKRFRHSLESGASAHS